ncbi:ankyrin repeat protein [Dictyocaulus viviparus]|uniref:Ankyrin repeat protein n=1 Tax=Dictyocaulus viviparus TaxID=29172 RepID=A0A0D8XVD4_DICVI|nr:ankyrin repeat protein [Dictyocaulus viviparus]
METSSSFYELRRNGRRCDYFFQSRSSLITSLQRFVNRTLAGNCLQLGISRSLWYMSSSVFDNENCTPLHYAAEQGHYEIVQLLLACGARNTTS